MKRPIRLCAALASFAGAGLFGLPAGTAHAMDVNETMELRGYLDLEWLSHTYPAEEREEEPGSFYNHYANVMFKARPMPGVFMLINAEFTYGGLMSLPEVPSISEIKEGIEELEAAEAAGEVSEEEHSESGGYGSPSVALHGAFLEVELAPNLKLRAGQFAVPYGHLNDVHDVTPVYYSVRIPRSVYNPTELGAEWDAFPKFNTGLGLVWDPGPVRLTAFVGNGSMPYHGVAVFDENKAKGFGLRIETDPVNPVTFYATAFGERNLVEEHEEEEESRLAPSDEEHEVEIEDESVYSLAVGSVMNFGDVEASIEAVGSTHEGMFQLGAFGEVALHSIKYVVPFVRYEFLVPDLNAGFNQNYMFVAGARIDLAPGRVFLKIEHDAIKVGDESEGEFRAAIVGWF